MGIISILVNVVFKFLVPKLKFVIDKSKEILSLPEDYQLAIMPGSDTGALEAALWCLLGERGVDILAWENFGKDWVIDVVDQLKITNRNVLIDVYGNIPDLSCFATFS